MQTKEEISAYKKRYYELHKKEKLAKCKLYYEKHKVALSEKSKLHYVEHIDEIRAYVDRNKELKKVKRLVYDLKNLELHSAQRNAWAKANNEKTKITRNKGHLNMANWYLAMLLRLSVSSLKKNPDFIQSYKQQLLTKRLLKTKKHESNKNH